jgi:pimeloyl-ACP methyl ester carboxylesterase
MPTASINGVQLYYEETGEGIPLVFVHEFAGDSQSWHPQVRFFARRFRTVTFNARGYPPSEVPEDPKMYSQEAAAMDIKGVLDNLGIARAHIVGLSMGAYATMHFGLRCPERALSLTLAACGSGSFGDTDRFQKDCGEVALRFERDGMEKVGEFYTKGPTRVPFMEKDPKGWREFHAQFIAQSAKGHALTMRGIQMNRPTVYDLEPELARLEVPALIISGDEDDPCMEPSLFMKRTIPAAGLLVLPKTGHTVNLEEPDAFNRAILDFVTAVESGRWRRRRSDSLGGSALLPPSIAERE